MKIQINFKFRKKIRFVFNENTYQFCVFKKIKFEKYRSVFELKKIISVFNENTDQF